MVRPPVLARALLAICLRGETREIIVGDLDEEFFERIASGASLRDARRHYLRQALASIAVVGRPSVRVRSAVPSSATPREWRSGLVLDARYTGRLLRKSPGYAAVAVLSLAIGIGANTAIFNIIRAMLLDHLTVDRPDQLVIAYFSLPTTGADHLRLFELNSSGTTDPQTGRREESNFTYPLYAAIKQAATPVADVFAFNFVRQVDVSLDGQPAIATSAALVTGNYFRAVRTGFVRGRPLDEGDDRPEAPPAAVISYSFWIRAFGGDPAIVGRTVRVDGMPCDIVGITQQGFRGLSTGGFFPSTELTLPLRTQPLIVPRWTPAGRSLFAAHDRWWLRIMARLNPGADDAALQRVLTGALRGYFDTIGLVKQADSAGMDVLLLPGGRGFDDIGKRMEESLRVLAGVVAVVLLMTCVNLASLLLARGVARQREIAVRRALGAGRLVLIRHLLTESTLLALLGGAAGLLLAVLIGPVIAAMLTAGLGPVDVDLGIDWRLFAVTAAVSGVTAILCGLIPAVRLTRGAPTDALRQHTVGSATPQLTIGRVLLALQLAISMPLVTGALLLLVTVRNLGGVDPGFSSKNLALFRVDPTIGGTEPGRSTRIYPQLLERLEALPGVTSATLMSDAVMTGSHSSTIVTLGGDSHHILMNAIGPRFFETMQIPIMAGRAIGVQDQATAPPVAVVNDATARRYFPNRSPIGELLRIGTKNVQIVGVAADARYEDLRRDIAPTFFAPYLQGAGVFQRADDPGPMYVAIRAALPPARLEAAIARAVAEVDRDLPVTDFKTETAQIDETMGKERAFTRLLTVFGALALLLACIGLHGVTAYSVARRTNEFGIRLALGARRSQIVWLVVRQVLILAIAGIAIGVPASLAASPLVGSLLYGLAPRDPVTLVVAGLVMGAVALAAGLLPAHRASQMEALNALRRE
jgi:predicted permease